ncbi:MAG: hypothetical protein HQL37_10340 [Alphaproteobacteria bacterium]|nr:hypothetical protein [Alphaproteobacteria bacterium]
MAKVDATTQTSMLYGMAEKSYTLNQIALTDNGTGTWLLLSPDGGSSSSAAAKAVALKLHGTQQLAQLQGLVGHSVTFGKVPSVLGGAAKWVVFYPKAATAVTGLAAGVGAVSAGAVPVAVSGMNPLLLQMDCSSVVDPLACSTGKLSTLTGKTYTLLKTSASSTGVGKLLFLEPVCDSAVAAKDIVVLNVQNASNPLTPLLGKSFTVASAPVAGSSSAGSYMLLQPATGLVGKGTSSTILVAKGMNSAHVTGSAAAKTLVPSIKTVALQTTGTGTASASTAAMAGGKAVAAAKGAGAAGTIWSGTLGLGLGLGTAGPPLLALIIAGTAYVGYRYWQRSVSEL